VAHKDIFVTDFERSGLPSTAGSNPALNRCHFFRWRKIGCGRQR
jgi:hypothetical protein